MKGFSELKNEAQWSKRMIPLCEIWGDADGWKVRRVTVARAEGTESREWLPVAVKSMCGNKNLLELDTCYWMYSPVNIL